MKEEKIDFATGNVSGLFRKIFFPTVLGMLSVSAVTTIDGIFVGHGVGSDGIAAVNICVPLLMILTGLGLMFGMGSSVLASIYLSKGKPLRARACVTQAMLMTTIIPVLAIAYILRYPQDVAYLLGSSEHLLPIVLDYLLWFAPSLVFELWIVVALFAVRLDGAPQLAMWSSIVAAVVNIVLDWLFIFPFGWGVMGAALATTISCMAGAGIVVYYLLFQAKHVRLHPLRLNARGVKFFLHSIGEQCKIGSSALLGEATMAVLMFVGNHVFMQYAGDDGVGAFGVSCYYLPFVFMIGNAIAQSAQPIISYNFGCGNVGRMHAALRVSLLTACICGLISGVAFIGGPKLLVGLFLPLDNAAAHIAVAGFPYYGAGFIFFILNLCFIGYYQSIERVKPATAFALLRGFIFLIPCFLLLPKAWSVPGIWMALPLSEVLTTLVIAGFVLRHIKSLRLAFRNDFGH
ncbi:MAG: MATE family efflux transporter [Bacteroides sp.]|nr:MATE family efflux transporter [Bacteroides sp.]